MFIFKSQSTFSQKLKKTFLRHWLAGIMSLSAAVFFMLAISYEAQYIWIKFVFMGFLLTFTSLAISLLLSTLKAMRWHHLAHYLALIVVGLSLFALLPIDKNVNGNEILMVFMVGCFVASLMLFLPLFKNEENLDFINYLKHLVVNFIVSIIFSLIVLAGFAGFYGILKTLFVVNISDFVYGATASLIFTIIGFWIFVFMLPDELRKIDFYGILDRILHILAAYVILPFSVIYAITIYIYALKIIFTNVWPQNQVAVFIGFLFVAWFVVYFLTQSAASKGFEKLRNYWRLMFAVCLPLFVMYFMAIGIRIREFGFTEERILALFLGIVWLIAGGYLALNRYVRFKYIPIVIGTIVLLMSFGPWSIYNISKHSQVARYVEFLTANEYIFDGQINKGKIVALSDKSRFEFRQKTVYLINQYGAESVAEFFPGFGLTADSQAISRILRDYLEK